MKEQHDSLLHDLKEKAKQFEDFIRKEGKSASTSPQKIARCDQSVSTSPELKVDENGHHSYEQQLRQELTQKYARDIKAIEKEFKDRIGHYHRQVEDLKAALIENEKRLFVRNQEVESLKSIVIRERERICDILRSKETEAEETITHQNAVLQKYKNEITHYKQRTEQLLRRLDAKDTQLTEEMKCLERLGNEMARERVDFENKKQILRDEITRQKCETEQTIRNLQDKLQSAKKTMENYKVCTTTQSQ